MVNAEESAFAVLKTTKNYRPVHVTGEQEDIMEKTMVENGIRYYLAEDGMYYPSISFSQDTDYSIGKYGIMAAEHIMEHDRARYFRLIREGRWNSYLHEIDMEIGNWVEKTVERIKEKEEIDERMKVENPLEWVQRVNMVRMMVEDVVLEQTLRK